MGTNMKDLIIEKAKFITDKELLQNKLKKPAGLKVQVNFKYNTERLHLGHWVILKNVKDMLNIGCKAVFVLQDFKLEVDKPGHYISLFTSKIGKFLNTKNVEIVSCRDILKNKETKDLLIPASLTNIADLLEIDFIREKFEKEKDTIGLNEILEQLIPSMATLEIEPDIIIAGENKKFHIDLSMKLFEVLGKSEPAGIIYPLLPGKNAEGKMSFKLNNAINIEESGQNLFNQIHQIPDSIVPDYFRILTSVTDDEIEKIEDKMNSVSDKELVQIKNMFAKLIVKDLGKDIESMKELNLDKNEFKNGKIWIVRLLELAGIIKSRGEGRRLIKQGGIRIDDEKITDPNANVKIEDKAVISKGKKVKIKINIR